MKKGILFLVFALAATYNSIAQTKFITRTGQASIFSHTAAEDIRANNNTVTGIINSLTGDVAISVPVQSFQFEKALMQEHFNSPRFMDSKQFPRIAWKGKIDNLSAIDFTKNGKYEAIVSGEITIKGVTKPLTGNANIEVDKGKVTVTTKLVVKDISSYGIGKPSGSKKNNVADDIEVSYNAVYEAGEQ
ncbi:MAG TPA: YceI family protein [Puia sp.]